MVEFPKGRCRGPRFSQMLGLFILCLGSVSAWAATYSVITTSDSGAGSLRQAILNANANSGIDTISFALTGSPPFNITPSSALPSITDPVILDATTQSGYTNHPVVALKGNNAGSTAHGL